MPTFTDVACTVCGCVCDDLRVRVEAGRITQAIGACALAEPWFLEQDHAAPAAAEIDGRGVTLDEAIQRAGAILTASRAPLVYGLSRSSTAGQRAAVRLADQIGATIDTTASLCHGPSIVALQQVGESTCTLGEIRNRADLVIYWGSNPMVSHPRHLERYSTDSIGMFVPQRSDRTLVVVDTQETATTALADIFLRVEPGRDFDVLWALRALVAGKSLTCDHSGETRIDAGAPLAALQDLAERMKRCRVGVVFFGLGLTQSGVGHLSVEALLRLVTDLNDHTRFHAKRMRIPGDVAGADSVLCWQTGYPFSVNLARGYPRYNPGEYSANDLLERDEVDACVLVGSDGVSSLSELAQQNLARLPVITLDAPTATSAPRPTVRFTTAVYGIHQPGTAYRMDEIPIPLRAILDCDYLSDAEVLSRIMARLPSEAV